MTRNEAWWPAADGLRVRVRVTPSTAWKHNKRSHDGLRVRVRVTPSERAAEHSEPHDGLRVRVRVTPRGGRDAIDGVETLSDGQAVAKARVRATPEAGAANEAVRRILAAAVDCAPSAVSLQAGAAARIKTFSIRGEGVTLGGALAAALEAP